MECYIPNVEPFSTTINPQRKSSFPNNGYENGKEDAALTRLQHNDLSSVMVNTCQGYTLTDLDTRHTIAASNPYENHIKDLTLFQSNQSYNYQSNVKPMLSELFSRELPTCMFSSEFRDIHPAFGRSRHPFHSKLDASQDPAMRSRPCFSSQQTRELEREFVSGQYITRKRRVELAYTLDLTEKQIKTWFQNRRVKERKTKKIDRQ